MMTLDLGAVSDLQPLLKHTTTSILCEPMESTSFVFFHDMFEHDEDGVAENDGEW